MASPFRLSPISASTKGEVKRLRKAGYIPVSLQHKGMTTLHFQQEAAPLDEFIRRYGDAALLDLLVPPSSDPARAIVHDVYRDPVTGRLLQVTFQQIRFDDTLTTHVSLVFVGEPAAAHSGDGVVQHQLDRLDISCGQNDLPDHITVNVADLQLGDIVRVSDLPVDPRYKITTPGDTVVASLTSTRAAISNEDAAAVAVAAEVPVAEPPAAAKR